MPQDFVRDQQPAAEEYNYPEGFVPKAWVGSKVSNRIVPDAVWLPDFFINTGKKLFPDEWDGKEIYARSPDEILKAADVLRIWRAQQAALQLSRVIDNPLLALRTLPPPPNSPETRVSAFVTLFVKSPQTAFRFTCSSEEGAAYSRKLAALNVIDEKIQRKEIFPFYFDNDGKQSAITPDNAQALTLFKDYIDVYMGKEPIKRKEQKPENICCPEGMWSCEALYRLGAKELGPYVEDEKVVKLGQRLIEVLITTPALEVFTINSYSGRKHLIDRDYLRSGRAVLHFSLGVIPPSSNGAGSEQYIFVNKSQFEDFLNGRPVIELPEEESELEKAARSVKKSLAIMNGERNQQAALENRQHSLPGYTPPYLELMLKAAAELNLSLDRRANMDDVVNWINQNWPPSLEGKSDRLIKSMATLLRRPQDKKGGNTRWSEE